MASTCVISLILVTILLLVVPTHQTNYEEEDVIFPGKTTKESTKPYTTVEPYTTTQEYKTSTQATTEKPYITPASTQQPHSTQATTQQPKHTLESNKQPDNVTSDHEPEVSLGKAGESSDPRSHTEDKSCRKSMHIRCRASIYRTIDGSCNNKLHPSWGQKERPYMRVLFPAYDDGVGTPRARRDGSPLPNPREVSSALSPMVPKPENPHYTYMVMQWGQFLTNDITLKATSKTSKGQVPDCCGGDRESIDVCMAIPIPEGDPLAQKGQSCMEFSRSKAGINENCTNVPLDQETSVTSFLDLSTIYGSDETRAHSLRSSQAKGQLEVSTSRHGDVLPVQNTNMKASPACQAPPCFIAGDARVNQQAALTSLHVLMIREHNRVAAALADLNPDWDDEKVYQETRRILIAELQHITYNEFLPAIMGHNYMERFELILQPTGYYHKYDVLVNPSIENAFSAAAYRFGHSLINDNFHRYNNDYERLGDLVLGDGFFNISLVRDVRHGAEFLLYGLVTQTPSIVDTIFTPEVTQRLFHVAGDDKGLDLFATNIQRGRDHGIPPYNDWRHWCGLSRLSHFGDIVHKEETWVWKEIERLYGDIDEVDLYVGGMAEPAMDGALMGRTLACIVGRQFLRLRRGDRFWYENKVSPHPFTPGQLDEVRKVTLARLMCDNLSGIKTVQPRTMRSHTVKNNHRVKCDDIDDGIDLSQWKATE